MNYDSSFYEYNCKNALLRVGTAPKNLAKPLNGKIRRNEVSNLPVNDRERVRESVKASSPYLPSSRRRYGAGPPQKGAAFKHWRGW